MSSLWLITHIPGGRLDDVGCMWFRIVSGGARMILCSFLILPSGLAVLRHTASMSLGAVHDKPGKKSFVRQDVVNAWCSLFPKFNRLLPTTNPSWSIRHATQYVWTCITSWSSETRLEWLWTVNQFNRWVSRCVFQMLLRCCRFHAQATLGTPFPDAAA